MSRICRGCGGYLGRDCFHESDCMSITESINQDNSMLADRYREQQCQHDLGITRDYEQAMKQNDEQSMRNHFKEDENQTPLLVASMASQIDGLELENLELKSEVESLKSVIYNKED